MPLTIANREWTVVGNKRVATGSLTFDSSYPTGGEPLTAGDLGLRAIDFIVIQTTSGLIFEYNYTGALLLAYLIGVRTGSTAVASAGATTGALLEDSADAETVARALGTAVNVTYNLGYLKEVPSTTNLSAISGVRFFAWGV